MTNRSVSFAPTSLFKAHFPKEVDAQTKQFLEESWQQRLMQKCELETIPITPAVSPAAETATYDEVHPAAFVQQQQQQKSYSEKEVKSAFYVGVAAGVAVGVLFLWLYGGGN